MSKIYKDDDDIQGLRYIKDSYIFKTIRPNQDIITFMELVIEKLGKLSRRQK